MAILFVGLYKRMPDAEVMSVRRLLLRPCRSWHTRLRSTYLTELTFTMW